MSHYSLSNLSNLKIHMIGIGGISMSALAIMLANLGNTVSGSDLEKSNVTQQFESNNIKFFTEHNAKNLKGCDLVCYTAAISADNPELTYARDNLIPTMERSELLGEIMKIYKYPIAVAGTHGKTTTTSMLSLILLRANLDPTVLVGGELSFIGGNYRIGSRNHLVCEACEYVDSFLKLNPYLSIITNVDEDHLDYFKNLDHITRSFEQFTLKNNPDGYVIFCADCPNASKSAARSRATKISFSIKSPHADFCASNIKISTDGHTSFEVYHKNTKFVPINLKLPGLHNIYNAVGAVAAAHTLGVSAKFIKSALEEFRGTKRRFEFLYKSDTLTLVDDYAHHPSEIKATLKAAKNMNYNKVWCAFQPHTYTRTLALMEGFAKSLQLADRIVMLDIYPAREQYTGEVHSCDLVRQIPNAVYINSFRKAAKYLLENAQKNDLIITMGAGDVYKVGLYLSQILNK